MLEPLFSAYVCVRAHAADNCARSFPHIKVQTPVSLHQVVRSLCTCVSEAGKWKDSGQQGQTRQPLRSHQVCRDTLEHSKPDGICPPGGAKQARWQTDTEAGKERRKNGGWHILPPNAQYVPATCMQLWTVTLTPLWTNYTVTPCCWSCTATYTEKTNTHTILHTTDSCKHTCMLSNSAVNT